MLTVQAGCSALQNGRLQHTWNRRRPLPGCCGQTAGGWAPAAHPSLLLPARSGRQPTLQIVGMSFLSRVTGT